jgi:hypothetical protein
VNVDNPIDTKRRFSGLVKLPIQSVNHVNLAINGINTREITSHQSPRLALALGHAFLALVTRALGASPGLTIATGRNFVMILILQMDF